MKSPVRLEYCRDVDGEWFWRAKATNHEILARSSESYHHRVDAEHAAILLLGERRYYELEIAVVEL